MEAHTGRRFERIDIVLAGLLAVIIGRVWLMALPSSLWVDEMVSWFAVRNPGHPSLVLAPQADSLYFWLPKIALRILGTSEVSLRVPSVLAMGVALYFVGQLAGRLIDPGARWFSIFACLALDGFNFFAVDARPYALGIALSSMSVFFLVRWFDRARWADEIAFIVLAALLWRVHLFYWPFYLVYAVYALVRFAARDTGVGALQVLLAACAISVALAPVALTAIGMHAGARTHVFNGPPTIVWFVNITQWGEIAVCGALAWILKTAFRWKASTPPVSGTSLTLILFWWLVCPVSLFVYSRVSGNGVLILRYVSLMLPGLALMATAVTAWFLPARYWKWAAVAMAAVALVVAANWTSIWPGHGGEGWRQAANQEAELATDATPVLCPSPFIEALPPVWTPSYQLPGFLYANLSYYPLRGRPLVFPFAESLQSDEYAERLLHSQLIPSGRFILYEESAHSEYLYGWLARQPELAAWHTRVSDFGGVVVVLYSLAPISEV